MTTTFNRRCEPSFLVYLITRLDNAREPDIFLVLSYSHCRYDGMRVWCLGSIDRATLVPRKKNSWNSTLETKQKNKNIIQGRRQVKIRASQPICSAPTLGSMIIYHPWLEKYSSSTFLLMVYLDVRKRVFRTNLPIISSTTLHVAKDTE